MRKIRKSYVSYHGFVQRRLNDLLRAGIEGGSSFIEEEDARLTQERTSDGDSLNVSGTELIPAYECIMDSD